MKNTTNLQSKNIHLQLVLISMYMYYVYKKYIQDITYLVFNLYNHMIQIILIM